MSRRLVPASEVRPGMRLVVTKPVKKITDEPETVVVVVHTVSTQKGRTRIEYPGGSRTDHPNHTVLIEEGDT